MKHNPYKINQFQASLSKEITNSILGPKYETKDQFAQLKRRLRGILDVCVYIQMNITSKTI